jgi:hypothetical protein
VTRCSGSDSCTNTAPLPIGSHYLCPDCAGTHHITTRGNR